MNKTRRAFTLIELLVVIAIIALLISILVPSLKRAKDLAKRMVCASQMRSMGLAFNTYANNWNGWYPPSVPVVAAGGEEQNVYCAYGSYRGWVGLGYVIREGIFTNPEVLYCPVSQNNTLRLGGSRGWPENGTVQSIEAAGRTVCSAYSYRSTMPEDKARFESSGKPGNYMALRPERDSPSAAVMSDGFYKNHNVHHGDGYNVLFVNGSATYWQDDAGSIAAMGIMTANHAAIEQLWHEVFSEGMDY